MLFKMHVVHFNNDHNSVICLLNFLAVFVFYFSVYIIEIFIDAQYFITFYFPRDIYSLK